MYKRISNYNFYSNINKQEYKLKIIRKNAIHEKSHEVIKYHTFTNPGYKKTTYDKIILRNNY